MLLRFPRLFALELKYIYVATGGSASNYKALSEQCALTQLWLAFADLTVGVGFDTGTQGAILSVGTNDNLIDRTRIGGKDVSAKGAAAAHLVVRSLDCVQCFADGPVVERVV